MNAKLSTLIDQMKKISFWSKAGIYLIGYIFSHLSISIIYHLALYKYSLLNELPYLYANKISITDIYPSLLYMKVPYLISCLLMYFAIITIVRTLKSKQQKSNSFKEKREEVSNLFRKYLLESDLYKKTIGTRSEANLLIVTSFTYILYGNTIFQEIVILLIQYSVPIYFAYKVAFKKNYISLFVAVFPLFLFLSSLSLFHPLVFNKILADNKIGGGEPVVIYDNVNKKRIEGSLILLTNDEVIIQSLWFNRILNRKDIRTIGFYNKYNKNRTNVPTMH